MGVNSAYSVALAVAGVFGSVSDTIICSGTVVNFLGDPPVPFTVKLDNDSTELSMGDIVEPPSIGGGDPRVWGDRKLRTSEHSLIPGTRSNVYCQIRCGLQVPEYIAPSLPFDPRQIRLLWASALPQLDYSFSEMQYF
jgi:hypothetical protein